MIPSMEKGDSMKKLLFVMNPCAGTKKANRYLAEIVSVFNRSGYEVIIFVTQAPGDAARIVRQKARQADVVVCCGGDGTFNETVTGLMESQSQALLGYIPAGSTNDFAVSLGLSADCVEAARRITEGSVQSLDIGRFGNRYFTYVASFGAFTRASYATSQSVKNALGHTAYLLEGIQELSRIRSVPVKLELDGQLVEDDFLFGAISNSTSMGGLVSLDPKQVDMSDGKFEVLLLRAPKELSELTECIQAVKKQQYNCRMLTFRSASRIRIWADPQMPWTLDGEREDGHEYVEAENLYRAIRLIK